MSQQVKALAANPDNLHFHLWSPNGVRKEFTSVQ